MGEGQEWLLEEGTEVVGSGGLCRGPSEEALPVVWKGAKGVRPPE